MSISDTSNLAPPTASASWINPWYQWRRLKAWFVTVITFPIFWLGRRLPLLHRFLAYLRLHRRRIAMATMLIAHTLGAVSSLRVLQEPRTAQGAVAWIISLNTFPYVTVPLYWTLGATDYGDYTRALASRLNRDSEILRRLQADLDAAGLAVKASSDTEKLLEKITGLPITRGNSAELLINGEPTFRSMFADLEQAEDYILVQFYILRDDWLGRRLEEILLRKARAGVRIFVLYDIVGSQALSKRFVESLTEAGVDIRGFNPLFDEVPKGRLNFRNHRKLVVVDGRSAFVGGHNVGDEYVGAEDELGRFRDTHVRVTGPVVQCAQVAFLEDWLSVTGKSLPGLQWEPRLAEGPDVTAFCLPTGPADRFETASMFFLQAINCARQRIWIASPYFVPDEQMVTALQLAALRGVDVRILLPENPDLTLVWLSSFSYLPELDAAGVKVYRYRPGFLHQKVVLVDDRLSAIGTANFDNRSFRLNFEIMLVFMDAGFSQQVAAMLERDFGRSRETSVTDLTDRSGAFQLLVQAARLLAPLQ